MSDTIRKVAVETSDRLGDTLSEGGVTPQDLVIGSLRGTVVFWMGCTQDQHRAEALGILRDAFNEEIAHLIRGISNGQVPA